MELSMDRSSTGTIAVVALLLGAAIPSTFAQAQGGISLQLNKRDQVADACRVAPGSNTLVAYAAIKETPTSFYAKLARTRLKKLKGQKVAVGISPEKLTPTADVPQSWKTKVTRLEKARAKGQYKPGDIFKDCDDCPEMVVVPAGKRRVSR